jgi:hypothetical protein
MDHEPLFRDVTQRLSSVEGIQALFLAGSYGQGKADRFSDLDFVAVAEQPFHDGIASAWRAMLEAFYPVVFWNEVRGRGILLNAVTEGWLRCDLYVTAPKDFVKRSQATVRPLFDRAGIYDGLPERLDAAVPSPSRVKYLINEFIRVLGLMTVGFGRLEYVTLVKGVGLLRDMLSDLMLEECPVPDRGGALHLSRLLRPDQMAILQGLPYPGPDHDQLIEAHVKIAEGFFPIARRLARQVDVAWPDAFEAATRAHVFKELGVRFE